MSRWSSPVKPESYLKCVDCTFSETHFDYDNNSYCLVLPPHPHPCCFPRCFTCHFKVGMLKLFRCLKEIPAVLMNVSSNSHPLWFIENWNFQCSHFPTQKMGKPLQCLTRLSDVQLGSFGYTILFWLYNMELQGEWIKLTIRCP